jgi:hypothetical protein
LGCNDMNFQGKLKDGGCMFLWSVLGPEMPWTLLSYLTPTRTSLWSKTVYAKPCMPWFITLTILH